jgi:hypothetical protein
VAVFSKTALELLGNNFRNRRMEETILSNGLSSSLQLREREAAAATDGASRQNNQCGKLQAEGLVDDRDDGSGAGDDDGDGDGEGLDDDPEVNYRDPPEGYLRLRPSQFHHIPATVFVEYPPELGPFSSSLTLPVVS